MWAVAGMMAEEEMVASTGVGALVSVMVAASTVEVEAWEADLVAARVGSLVALLVEGSVGSKEA